MQTSVTASSKNHPNTLCSRIRTAAPLGLSLFLLVALSWTVGTTAANAASSTLVYNDVAYGDDDPVVKTSGTKAPRVLRHHRDQGPDGIKLPAPTVSDASSLFGTAATGRSAANAVPLTLNYTGSGTVAMTECVYCSGKDSFGNKAEPKGKSIKSLTLKYIGSGSGVSVTVADASVLVDGVAGGSVTVSNGTVFTIGCSGTDCRVKNPDLLIDGTSNVQIHSSCSVDISPGTVHGDFEVVSGIDRNGHDLCSDTPVADLECADSGLITSSPTSGLGIGVEVTFTFSIENVGAFKAKDTKVTFYYPNAFFGGGSGVGSETMTREIKVGETETFVFMKTITSSAIPSAAVFAEVTEDKIDDFNSVPGNVGVVALGNGNLDVTGTFDGDNCAGGTVLPVELTAFEAVLDGRAAVLSWTTASETNNAGFEVQHRFGETAFEPMEFVEGHGTTLDAQSYSYRAENLDPGSHVFRLKQIDFDGTFEYSPELEVTVEMPEMYFLSAVYPNPFNPEARLDFAVRQSQAVTVTAYNLLGQRVLELYSGVPAAGVTQSLVIDGSGLQSGMYMVRIQGERFVETRTFTMIK